MISSICRSGFFFFFSSRRRHTRFDCDWSSDVCSSDLILLDAKKNLLVLPVTVSLSPNPSVPNSYGSPVWQGAYVFQITTNTLTFRGGVTHIPDALPPSAMTSPLTITRELYIGGILYTISSAMIGMNSLSDLQVVGSLSLF